MYPDERSLVAELKDAPFALIGVNSDKDKDTLRPRMVEEKITWRSFWCGEAGTGGAIPKAWKVTGWPTTYVIDHEGIIRFKGHGGPKLIPTVRECVEAAQKAQGQKAPKDDQGK
jgi:hypothetical protein